MPLKTRSGPASVNLVNTTNLYNRFSPLEENGNVSEGKESEALSSGILRYRASSLT
jgi:hypothetical protein